MKKVCFLILAGGDNSHLHDLEITRKTWLSTHDNRFTYFEFFGRQLEKLQVKSNQIIVDCEENYGNLLKKTILGIRQVLKVDQESQFFVRTNVSSYFEIEKIRNVFIELNKNSPFIAGYTEIFNSKRFVSGSAIFMSRSALELLATMDPDDYLGIPDDVAISRFLIAKNVTIFHLKRGNPSNSFVFLRSSHYRLKISNLPYAASRRMNLIHQLNSQSNLVKRIRVRILIQLQEFYFLFVLRKDLKNILKRLIFSLKNYLWTMIFKIV